MLPNKMNLDVSPLNQPKGTHRLARNLIHDMHAGETINEPGFTSVSGYPEDLHEIGTIALPDDDALIISKITSDVEGSELVYNEFGVFDSNDQYTKILRTRYIDIPYQAEVKGFCYVNYKGDRVVLWADGGHSPARILNIDDLPFDINPTTFELSNHLDAGLVNLFLDAKAPTIENVKVNNSGGFLKSGSYSPAIAYESRDGSRTNVVQVMNPIPISGPNTNTSFDQYGGFEPGAATGKSIFLSMVDLDERYEKVVLYMLKHVESATTAEEVGTFAIDASNACVIEYTGAEGAIDVLLDEVLIASPNYVSAQTLTYHQNKVMIGGVSTDEILDAQEAALEINATPVSTQFVSLDEVNGSHKDGTKLFLNKFFMPDEVYALYLSWIGNDGSKFPAVHIPGREAETVDYFEDAVGSVEVAENATIQSIIDDSDIVNQSFLNEDIKIADGDERFKLFHTRNSNGENLLKMGYWENAELYPEGFPGTLADGATPYAGSPVRHHRFPSLDDMETGVAGKRHIWTDTSGAVGLGSLSYVASLVEGGHSGYPNYAAPVLADNGSSVPSGVTATIEEVDLGTEPFLGFFLDEPQHWLGSQVEVAFTQRQQVEVNLDLDYRLAYVDHDGDYVNYDGRNSQIVSVEKWRLNAAGALVFIGYLWLQNRQNDGTGEHEEWAYINGDWSGDTKFTFEAGETLIIKCAQHSILFPAIFAPDNAFQGSIGINILGASSETGEEDGTLFGQGWGLYLDNINVPESLKGKVQGYEIFYAKRTLANSTVISQSVLFNPVSGSTEQEAEPGEISNNTHKFSHHGFDLLANGTMPTILPTHLKVEMEICDVAGTGAPSEMYSSGQVHQELHSGGTFADKMDNQIRSIKQTKYKPFDAEHRREEWFEGIMDSDLVGGDASFWLKANLCSYKANAYKLFETQELVSMGIIYKVPDDELTYNTGYLYGGDVTLDVYGLRTSYCTTPGTTTPTFSKYSFPTLNALPAGLRYEGTDIGEQYIPKVDTTDVTALYEYLGLEGGLTADLAEFTNFVAVDLNLGKLNVFDKAYPLSRDEIYITDHPYRIVMGEPVQDETYERDLRRFKPFSYYELEKGKGTIVNLESVGNDLLIHTTDTLFKTMARTELQTSEENIVVGSGELFRMPPVEVAPSERGYGGLQEISGAHVCKAGYTWIDNVTGKVFLYDGKLHEISDIGMRRFFEGFKGWSINAQRVAAGVDPYDPSRFHNGIGYSIALDEKYNRLLFTKRDYRASQDEVDEWQNTEGPESSIPPVLGGDNFTQIGFTASFSLDSKAWSSLHDYYPQFYIERKDSLLSTSGNACYTHNAMYLPGVFYDGERFPMWVDYVLNEEPSITKSVKNIKWQSAKRNALGNLPYHTFDNISIYNDSQCTGEIDLVYDPAVRSNLAYIEDMWRVNNFYNIVIDSAQPFILSDGRFYTPNLDPALEHDKKSRIRGKYAIIRIKNSNMDNYALSLYNLYHTVAKSIR